MQKSLYIFSHILLIGTFAAGCKDIERDNILDPKNPNSFRPHVVTVEAFVNTSPELPYNYNDIMLEALEQLKTIYAAKIIVSHYHRDVQEYKDNYALFESDQLYDKYIAFFDPETKGVPDVFLDGTRRRIQGATSVSTTRQRIEEQLADLLITNSYFTIESALRQENDRILPAAKFARLGTEAAYNLLAKVVILEEISSPHLSRVVRKVLKSNIINTIAPGEIKEIAFESYTVSGSNPVIVVYQICSADELNVYYTQEVRLK